MKNKSYTPLIFYVIGFFFIVFSYPIDWGGYEFAHDVFAFCVVFAFWSGICIIWTIIEKE